MKLGDYVFEKLPTSIDNVIRPQKRVAEVETYSGVSSFSWGVSVIGTKRTLSWNAVPIPMFNELDDLYAADQPFVWDLEDGTDRKYQVEIMDLSGTYLQYFTNEQEDKWYQSVTMQLLIIGEVT